MKIGSWNLATPKLSPRSAKVLRGLGYFALYLVVFVLFAYVSFPYDRLKDRLIASYAATQSGSSPSRLTIDDLSWSWRFPGIIAEGVRLEMSDGPDAKLASNTTAGVPAPPAQRDVLEAEELFVRIAPLALLTGARSVSFSAKALGGELHGSASDSEAGRSVDMELEDIDPSGIPQLARLIGLPLRGRLSGHIVMDVPEGKVTKAEGTFQLRGEELQIGDGKAKIRDMIALPPIEIGELKLSAEIAAGRLKITECVATGRDVEFSMTGGLRLRQRLDNSLADFEAQLNFSEKYKGQNEMTKALFGQPDSKVPGLFDSVTKTIFAKLDDGAYAARLTGPVSRLNVRPLSQRSSGSSRGRNKGAPAASAEPAEGATDGE